MFFMIGTEMLASSSCSIGQKQPMFRPDFLP